MSVMPQAERHFGPPDSRAAAPAGLTPRRSRPILGPQIRPKQESPGVRCRGRACDRQDGFAARAWARHRRTSRAGNSRVTGGRSCCSEPLPTGIAGRAKQAMSPPVARRGLGAPAPVGDFPPGATVAVLHARRLPVVRHRYRRAGGWSSATTAGPVVDHEKPGCKGRIMGGFGGWLKLKSCVRSPRIAAFSRTSGRGSGRPSVSGLSRCPPRKSSSMNFR
jgi:hypothetical protein